MSKGSGGGRAVASKPSSGQKTAKNISEMSLSEAKEEGRFLEKLAEEATIENGGKTAVLDSRVALLNKYEKEGKRAYNKAYKQVKEAADTFGLYNIREFRSPTKIVTKDGRLWLSGSQGDWYSSNKYDNKGEMQQAPTIMKTKQR